MTDTREEERIAALMLFKSLGPKDAGEVNDIMEAIEIASGDRLFDEGDPGDALYIIRDGAIEIRKRTPGGSDQVLATLGKFALFGEMSLLTDAPRTAAALAKSPTRLYRVRKDAFLDLLKKESIPAFKICLAIARFLAHRLGRLDEELVALMEKARAPETKAQIREFTDFKAKLFSQWHED